MCPIIGCRPRESTASIPYSKCFSSMADSSLHELPNDSIWHVNITSNECVIM